MRLAPRIFAAVVLLVSLALGRASALEAVRGSWTIEPGKSDGSERIELQLDSGDGSTHDSSSFDIRPSVLGIASALSAPNTSHVSFTIAREAGSLAATGTAGRGTGAGTFTFAPSDAFRNRLHGGGYPDLDSRQLFSGFSVNLTTEFLDRVSAAGYAHLPFENAIAFRALGIDADYIGQMKAAFPHVEIEPGLLTSLRALGVTSDYVAQIRGDGVTISAPDNAVQLRALGIDGAYLKRVESHGFHHLPIDKLIELKAMGVVSARFEGIHA